MEYEIAGLLIALLLWVAAWATIMERRHRRKEELGQLPPGPRRWPVVGNIFQLGWPPHVSFANLAHKHGPIMTLWLGSMSTVVISSNDVARELFKYHDEVLSGRKIYESMKGDFGNEGSIITSQYGPHWRMLRRLCTAEFFVTSRLDALRDVRVSCVDDMLRFIEDAAGTSGTSGIDVGRFFFFMTFNLIGNLLFSRDLLDPKSEKGARFFYHMGKVMELAGKPNVADYFPIFKRVDPQGLRKKTQFHINQAFQIAGSFIKERMKSSENGIHAEKVTGKDYLDVLLEFEGNSKEELYKFSSRTINVIIFEMFVAGTDTTTTTLEWAMAELLRNPQILDKVQIEIRTIVPRKLEETDVENLPYLKAVVKETLRLHPPLPFLVPHMAMDSCKMLGFHIPKETQILVNVWAIGRDPKTWKDPKKFRPERFLDPDAVDYKGQNYEFIPFGSGRRMCPAMPLASRVLTLALGSVLQSFDWASDGELRPEDMDMTERMGVTLKKCVPLKAVPIKFRGYELKSCKN